MARVLLSLRRATRATGSHDIEVVAQATVHCHDLDLEAPITINTLDPTPLDRDGILTYLARCGLDVKTGANCL